MYIIEWFAVSNYKRSICGILSLSFFCHIISTHLLCISDLQRVIKDVKTKKNITDVELTVIEESPQPAESEDQARSSTESLAIAQLHTCPTCLGRDLCTEISQGFLTVSMFGKETSTGTEYQGMLNNDEQLAVFSPSPDMWESWDKSVCKNSSQWKGCLVGEAAKNSFLYWSKGDAPFLRKMFTFRQGFKNKKNKISGIFH